MYLSYLIELSSVFYKLIFFMDLNYCLMCFGVIYIRLTYLNDKSEVHRILRRKNYREILFLDRKRISQWF
jgi:hypothetical protein